jgi:hypothetical protein
MIAEEKKVIEELETQLTDLGFESIMKDIDGLEVLRVLLDEIGKSGEGEAIIEFCFLPLGDDDSSESTDLRLFQVYTTLAANIDEKKDADILVKINDANMECLLGNFGIYAEERQMYHKYVSVVRGDTAEEMLKVIQPAVNWIETNIAENFDEIVSLCS